MWILIVSVLDHCLSFYFGYKNSRNRVSQCLTSIRKLGNRRRSERLRSFKPSRGNNLLTLISLTGDIEMNPGPRF